MLSQQFQPNQPAMTHRPRQLFHNRCISLLSREKLKIHTERSDKQRHLMQALLSRVGRTGGVMDSLQTVERPPHDAPPPPTEALS